MLEKAAALERFENSPLGKELKAKTDIAKKQYLDDTDELDDTINKKSTLKNNSESDLTYDTNRSFFKYYRDKKKFIKFLLNQSIYFYPNF